MELCHWVPCWNKRRGLFVDLKNRAYYVPQGVLLVMYCIDIGGDGVVLRWKEVAVGKKSVIDF